MTFPVTMYSDNGVPITDDYDTEEGAQRAIQGASDQGIRAHMGMPDQSEAEEAVIAGPGTEAELLASEAGEDSNPPSETEAITRHNLHLVNERLKANAAALDDEEAALDPKKWEGPDAARMNDDEVTEAILRDKDFLALPEDFHGGKYPDNIHEIRNRMKAEADRMDEEEAGLDAAAFDAPEVTELVMTTHMPVRLAVATPILAALAATQTEGVTHMADLAARALKQADYLIAIVGGE